MDGSALIWALLFVVITSGMVVSHAAYMASSRRQLELRFRHTTLAGTFARSGLTDAMAWFQKQATQPVTDFAPQLDPAADPPLLETLDPTLGLVREFEVHGDLWGRYEVRGDEVFDVSGQRGQTTPGSVWDVGARGFIYRLVDATARFDQLPNQVVAVTNLRTEMRGIPMLPPAQAAISMDDPTMIVVGSNGRVVGGGSPAFAFPDDPSLGYPAAFPPGAVGGTPPTVAVLNYNASPPAVFSMRLEQLRALADLVLTASMAGSGSTNPDRWRWRRAWFGRGQGQPVPRTTARSPRDSVVFVDGDLMLDPAEKLRGRMLLAVDGDLVARAGNDTKISGLVYVTGNVSLDGPFRLDGMLISRGSVVLGNGSDLAEVHYDSAALDVLKKALARYRLSRALRPGSGNGF